MGNNRHFIKIYSLLNSSVNVQQKLPKMMSQQGSYQVFEPHVSHSKVFRNQYLFEFIIKIKLSFILLTTSVLVVPSIRTDTQ